MGSRDSSSRTGSISGWERAARWFRQRYLSVDPRWLGVFRILLGTLLIVDLLRRWLDIRAFYTNDGILPNHYSLYRPMGAYLFSLYHAFSTFGEVNVAFALTLVIYVLFAAGYRTKLFHILSALCITSLNSRNLFVQNGGTVVVNIITIWTLFLPLGRRISVDAVLRSLREHPEHNAAGLNDRSYRDATRFVSLVVLALILQWSCIYFFNTVHKTGHGWKNGSAIYWFWQQDRIVTWFSIWARNHVPMSVVHAMTHGTLVVEGTLAFILLVPFFQKWTRRIALLLALMLHGGIALSARLGPFSYVMVSFFVLLLGNDDWKLVGRWFGRPQRARTVIYDADCGICLQVCRILARFDPFARLHFVENSDAEQIPDSVDAALLDHTVVALDPSGRVHIEERAVFEIVRALPFGILAVFWMRLPGLSSLARHFYRRVADNRMRISAWFGLGVCGVPDAGGALVASAVSAVSAGGAGDDDESSGNEVPARRRSVADEDADEQPDEDDDEQPDEDDDEQPDEDDDEQPDEDDDEQPDEDGSSGGAADEEPESRFRDELAATLGFLRETLVVVLAVAVGSQLCVENAFVRQFFTIRQPQWMAEVVAYPRIFQGWSMFAPEPPYDDGHLVVDGRTVDGRKLDPLTGKPPDFDPYAPNGWGLSQLWCDYENRIRFAANAGQRQFLRSYLLNLYRYEGRPQDRLVAFDVWWVQDKSPPPGQKRGQPLPPLDLLSYGRVTDSGATPWLQPQGNQ
jgi:predicted DCC family thiol-disulfide oxidoreductase YuxK